mmetsp:Transcript_78767/g.234741  ORF Transcript_78767/g.234741 Transcript_78767/m.234741 type:complete len:216 (+) Transcript_78767:1032-1679(+)
MSSAARRTSESRATSPFRWPRSIFARLVCSACSAMASIPAPTAVWCTIANSVMSTLASSSGTSCLPEAAFRRTVKRSFRFGGGPREISLRFRFAALLLPGSVTATRSSSWPSPVQQRPATSPRAPKVSLSPLEYFTSAPPKKTTSPKMWPPGITGTSRETSANRTSTASSLPGKTTAKSALLCVDREEVALPATSPRAPNVRRSPLQPAGLLGPP